MSEAEMAMRSHCYGECRSKKSRRHKNVLLQPWQIDYFVHNPQVWSMSMWGHTQELSCGLVLMSLRRVLTAEGSHRCLLLGVFILTAVHGEAHKTSNWPQQHYSTHGNGRTPLYRRQGKQMGAGISPKWGCHGCFHADGQVKSSSG